MKLSRNGRINLIGALNYSDVFHEPPPAEPFHFLRCYPTDLILMRVAKMNAILYLEQDILVQNARCLREVVFEGLPSLGGLMGELSALLYRTHQSAFAAPANSRMIKDALENHVAADIVVDEVVFAFDLLKAALAYNEHYLDVVKPEEVETFGGLFRLDMLQQYYLRRERYLKLDMLLKFAFLAKFLSVDDQLKQPAFEYCQQLKIGTVWNLASFFLNLFARLLTREKVANYRLDIKGVDLPVMDQFIFRKADLKPKLSLLLDIIPKPLYELDQHSLLILDYNYFTYGLDQGVLYSIYKKSSLANHQQFKNFNAYKSYVGLAYFEQFIVGNLCKQIFTKWNQRVISNEKYQDFIIRAGNNIFIMEVKMTDFHANGLENEDFAEFKVFINKNFLNFKEEGGKNKGLAQLLRQIGYLQRDTELHLQLGVSDPQKLTVYPIMVYADANLDMNGVNNYINEKAQSYLLPYQDSFQKLNPVIMINGTCFTHYYQHLRKDPALFAKWLADYLKGLRTYQKRYQTEGGPRNYFQYNHSFAEHLRRKFPEDSLGTNLDAIQKDFDLEIRNFGQTGDYYA